MKSTKPKGFPQAIAIVLAVTMVLIVASAVQAATTFNIRPMITVSTRYDTNFWKMENNEREVWTFYVAPGIHLGMETSRLSVQLDATLEAFWYDDVGNPDRPIRDANKYDYVGYLIALNASYNPAPRLTLLLKDSLYRTRDGAYSDNFDNTTDRLLYIINTFTTGAIYDFENKFETGLRYRRTDIDYDKSIGQDSYENRGIYNLLYDPNRSNTIELELQYWDQNYIGRSYYSDYNAYQAKLIWEKRWKYTALNAGVGWQYRNYDNSDLAGESSASTPSWKVSVTWQNPAPPEMTRRIGEFYVRSRTHAYLAVEQNFNNLGNTYVGSRVTASVGHVFLEKIQTRIKGYYLNAEYEDYYGLGTSGTRKNRNDDIWYINGSVGYMFRPDLVLTLEGGYEDRNSNQAGRSYDNKFCLLKIEYEWDLGARGGYTDEGIWY